MLGDQFAGCWSFRKLFVLTLTASTKYCQLLVDEKRPWVMLSTILTYVGVVFIYGNSELFLVSVIGATTKDFLCSSK